MDSFNDPRNVFSFVSLILTLIMDANVFSTDVEAFQRRRRTNSSLHPYSVPWTGSIASNVMDCLSIAFGALHNFRLCCLAYPMSNEISYWVKPRSTTWFSRFLLEQYDDLRWLSMLKMTKSSIFSLANLLAPHVQKNNIKYRLAIPILIWIACTLFKLTHGANLMVCSEMFTIGRNTVCTNFERSGSRNQRHFEAWGMMAISPQTP